MRPRRLHIDDGPDEVRPGDVVHLAGRPSSEIEPYLDALTTRGLDLHYHGPGDRYVAAAIGRTSRDRKNIRHGEAHAGGDGRPDAVAMIRHVPQRSREPVTYYKAEWSGRWRPAYVGAVPDLFFYVHKETDPTGLWRPIRREDIPRPAYARMRAQMKTNLPSGALSSPARRR